MKFRRINKWWANLRGYFWSPCPLCGQYFGGHEKGRGVIWTSKPVDQFFGTMRTGKCICPDCAEQGLGDA